MGTIPYPDDTCARCNRRRFDSIHMTPRLRHGDHDFVEKPVAHDPHANPHFERLVPRDAPAPTVPMSKRAFLRDDRPQARTNELYLIGSLRNPQVPSVGNKLREAGWDVYDDWFAGGPEADDKWKEYELARGHNFIEALGGHTAHNIFHFDTQHINRCSVGLLLMPAGKSAHLELGAGFIGRGKPGHVITDDPDRFDVMYRYAHGVFADVDAFLEHVRHP